MEVHAQHMGGNFLIEQEKVFLRLGGTFPIPFQSPSIHLRRIIIYLAYSLVECVNYIVYDRMNVNENIIVNFGE